MIGYTFGLGPVQKYIKNNPTYIVEGIYVHLKTPLTYIMCVINRIKSTETIKLVFNDTRFKHKKLQKKLIVEFQLAESLATQKPFGRSLKFQSSNMGLFFLSEWSFW